MQDNIDDQEVWIRELEDEILQEENFIQRMEN